MSLTLAIVLLGLAVVLSLGTGLWMLVLAFQRRIWWGLAVLFVPLANLIFIVVDWQNTKRPFLLSLLALPLGLGAWFALPKDHPAFQILAQRMTAAPTPDSGDIVSADGYALETARPLPPAATVSPAAEIETRLAALQKKEAALLARKKALDPRDKAAALALSHEIVAYNGELQEALAARQQLIASGALLVPASTPATGAIAGLPFTVEKATLKDGILTLRQGQDFFADREVSIFLFLKSGENPIGRKWEVGAGQNGDNPHVHLSWREAGQTLPKTKILMNDYRLHLELAPGANGAVCGRIAFAAPGEHSSRVNGTFTAQVAAK